MAPWPNNIPKPGWLLIFCLYALAQRRSGVLRRMIFGAARVHSFRRIPSTQITSSMKKGRTLFFPSTFPASSIGTRMRRIVKLTLTEDLHLDAHHRPCSQSYELKIACAQPQEFTIKFRMPWWMNGNPEVVVNGEKQAVSGSPSTYASIRRVWHNDTLQISLPQVSA